MRILFLPLAVPRSEPPFGALSRALPRALAARQGEGAEFFPFVHLVEGRRVFGVYKARWPRADLENLLAAAPETDFVVHGEADFGDPFEWTIEVLRRNDLEPVAEETFSAPRAEGLQAVAEGEAFLRRTLDREDGADGYPTRTFEGWLDLIRAREAAAALDLFAGPEEAEAAPQAWLAALEREPDLEVAKEELSLFTMSAVAGGFLPAAEAGKALEALTGIDPECWRAHAAVGQVRASTGDLRGAQESFERALQIDPGRAALRFDLGLILLRQERPGPAAKALETVKTDPRLGAAALFELGRIRSEKGDLDGAIGLWEQAAEAQPGDARILAAIGRAFASRGEFDQAEAAFRRGLAAEGGSAELALAWGLHLAEQDRHGEAAEPLRTALRLGGPIPEAHLHLGRGLAAAGRRDAALHHLRKALRAGGKAGADAREALSGLTSVDREEKLLDLLDAALTQPAEDQGKLLKGLLKEEAGFVAARIRLGIALLAQGRARRAEKQFRRVLKVVPDDPEAHSGLASALRKRGKFDQALAVHEEILVLAPHHAPFHLNHADTLLRMDRVDEAMRAIARARALDPEHPLLPGFVKAVKLRLEAARMAPDKDPDDKENG